MLSKSRLEAFSDGVFAVVITILALELKIPEIEIDGHLNHHLIESLSKLGPVFFSYFFSFAIIAMYWVSHHAFYAFYVKVVDRWLNLINLLYLSVLCVIPFSAHLLGTYFNSPIAVIIYGVNVTALSAVTLLQFLYLIRSKNLEKNTIDARTQKQGLLRVLLTPLFSVIGILVSFINPYLALFCFGFPILFNLLPGGLDLLEKIFGFKI
jgi:uncharacterized membrane protein